MDNIVLFEEKQVRRVWEETDHRWFISVADTIALLADSDKPCNYWHGL